MVQQPHSNSAELEATPGMCHHCFDVLIEALKTKDAGVNKRSSIPPFASNLSDASVECPLFVTWSKQVRGDNWQLRGCIGTLSPRLLVTSVGEYALISALRDRRFNPIALSELPALRVSVSLLVNYEECQNVYDWTLGIHGILIKLPFCSR